MLAKSREAKEYIKPVTIVASKKQTTKQRTRLKVTVCLYFNPSNSASNLSTLIAVKNTQSQVKNTPFATCNFCKKNC